MITIRQFLETTRAILTNLRALAIFAGVYALLLATLYFFIATREATVWQVLITLVFLVLIPAEFFIFQAAIIDRALDQKFHWRAILITAFKLFVATIPILIIGCVLFILLNKWQAHFPAPSAAALPVTPGRPPKPQPLHWPTLLFATLRGLLFAIALPLATIHLWIEVAACDLRASLRSGAKTILKRLGNRFSCAFTSESVLIYALGLIIFVLVPYLILFVPIPVKGTKTDFAVFILRLVLVFVFTLIGWIATVTTLAKTNTETATVVSTDTIADTPAEAPA
jgi:hypothetical protein